MPCPYPLVVHFDDASTTRLRVLLMRVVRRAQAKVAAVFVPRGEGLALVVQVGVDQAALDIAHAGWLRHNKTLRAGRVVRFGMARLWPLFDGPAITALVFVDRAPEDFPDERMREDGALIALRAPRCGKLSALDTYAPADYRPEDVIAEFERDRLVLLLRQHRGNVSAIATAMGVCRDTVYDRIAHADLDLAAFRPRTRERRLRAAATTA